MLEAIYLLIAAIALGKAAFALDAVASDSSRSLGKLSAGPGKIVVSVWLLLVVIAIGLAIWSAIRAWPHL
ncbi:MULTISPECIES: hypothetical protein [Kordiimonas]|uniref:hypothetical protein n=1 Tax=Kordiimonas TaxID=288021 RepID=UPI00257C6539|nr:hypothetical protein [Kordiimonas sp. UBA4487]